MGVEERLIQILRDLGISPGNPKFNDAFADLVKQKVAEIQNGIKNAQDELQELEKPREDEGYRTARTRALQISFVAIHKSELVAKLREIRPLAKSLGIKIEEELLGETRTVPA